MNVLWYYASGGRTFGPFSWAELRDAARAGGFGPADHVWTPGYGAEWKRASELGTLFPPPQGAAGAPGASNAAGAPNGALSGDARASGTPSPEIRRQSPPRLPVEERSPFRTPEPDGRTPAPPRVLLSLRNAWSNLLTILLDRFSLRRTLVFCLCALLLFLGAQSEIPTVSDDPAARSRLEEAGPGLAALAEFREDILRRAALLQEEAGGLDGRPDAVRAAAGAALRGLGGAMREQCAAILNWTRTSSLSQRLSVFGVSALLLAALCALRAWFLSRAWTLFPLRVYRRDEPMLLSWAEAQRPAHALFRGLFAIRLATLALQAVATVRAVRLFGTLPAGPVPARTVLAELGLLALPALLDGLLSAFVRDLVAPRILLLRLRFRPAMRAAARDLGFWTVRYLIVLFALLFVEAQAVGAVFLLAGAASLPPVLLPVLWAIPAMPFELLRTLFSLDVLFRLHPDAREAVPPRLLLAVRTVRRPRGGDSA